MPKSLQKIWTEKERKAWRLPPAGLTVSSWADEDRVIGSYSAEPGPWQTSKIPCSKGIMNAYSDYEVDVITIVGLAQLVKTECVFNMIGYTVEVKPIPSMYVCARDEDVEDICTDRLEPMFRESPALARHLLPSPRSLRAGHVFRFDNMPLYFTGAQSAAALAAKAIGNLFLDETDKYPNYVGSEGSPIKLAERRTTTFPDSKIVYLCTPTTKEGFIYLSYMRSNMQRFYVPCPRCGRYQLMDFFNLKVDPPDLRNPDIIREQECVYYECKHCHGRIQENEKYAMHGAGEWVPEGQSVTNSGKIIGKPKRSKRHSGFWLPELLSPWPKQRWADILAGWFEAVEMEKVKPGELREFFNQAIGRIHEEKGEKIEESQLDKLKGDFSGDTVPDDCIVLFAVADYHKTEKNVRRIDYEVRGFGYYEINRVISYGSVSSFDLLDKATWNARFPWSNPDNHKEQMELSVSLMFLDSGFKPDDIYAYCRKRPGICIPTKGASGKPVSPLQWSDLDRTKRKGKRAGVRAGDKILLIDTEFFKNKVTGWCEPEYNEKGEITAEPKTKFFMEIPQYYFNEFTNEHKIKIVNKYGQTSYRWVPVYTGAPTHALDLAVLSTAAAWFKKIHLLRPKDTGPPGANTKSQRSRRIISHGIRTKY